MPLGLGNEGKGQMLKKVRIAIKTIQNETNETLFEDTHGSTSADAAGEEQVLAFTASGSYYDDGTRISIAYREGEQTGMDNTRTTISFFKNDPESVTLTRDSLTVSILVPQSAHAVT